MTFFGEARNATQIIRTIDSCTVLESILVPKGEKSKKFDYWWFKIMGFKKDKVVQIQKLVDYRNAIFMQIGKNLRLTSRRLYSDMV